MEAPRGSPLAHRYVIIEPALDLLPALRGISDVKERREVTSQVHSHRVKNWKAMPEFTSTAASHLVADIHSKFRVRFSDILSEALTDGNESRRWVNSFLLYCEMLHHHHSIEDKWWFPRLRSEHPHIHEELRILESDHIKLSELEEQICKLADLDALSEFVLLLEDHLNREEILTVPLLLDGSSDM